MGPQVRVNLGGVATKMYFILPKSEDSPLDAV